MYTEIEAANIITVFPVLAIVPAQRETVTVISSILLKVE